MHFLVLLIFIYPTSQAQEVEKKNQEKVEAKKAINKEVIKAKKNDEPLLKEIHQLEGDKIKLLKKHINLIYPAKTDKNVTIDTSLTWELEKNYSNPNKGENYNGQLNNSPLSKPHYDVYFGTGADAIRKVSSGQKNRSYKPRLRYNTTYYWKVDITGSEEEVDKSLVQSFKTESKPEPEEVQAPIRYPNAFKHITTYPKSSHLGDKINAEGIQGLAHSPTNWYWTNAYWKMTKVGISEWRQRERAYIYKTEGDHLSRKVKKVGVPSYVWKRGYHHLSDPDFYKGYLYVPIEKGKYDVPGKSLPPYILVFDEDLNYLTHGVLRFHDEETGKSITSGGAWCAINPKDGLLYVSRGSGTSSSGNYSILDVYWPNIFTDLKTQKKRFKLVYRHSVKLNFRHTWNDMKVYIQGGAFSPDGLFYYVMDPKYEVGGSKKHSQSGIHVFKIDGEVGTEIIVKGKDNNSNVANHIKRVYRFPEELEGLDFVSPNEPIYKDLLSNMREIDIPSLISDTEGVTTGFILATQLSNIFREDEINLFHYQLIQKP